MKKMLSLLIALAMVLSMVPAAFAAEATTAITVQPSSVTAAEGSNAQFLVVVDGEVASYQWQYDMGEGWSDCTDGNTDTLTVVAAAHRNNYQYRCVITGADGSEIISDVATLTVGTAAAVEIKVQPNSMLAAAGTNAQFEVVVDGTDLEEVSYQWQLFMGSTWTDVVDKATTSLLTVKAESHRHGFRYRCVITDANGVQIVSNAATLTIGDATAQIVINNQSQVVAEGANATFTVVASGEVAGYQWQFNDGWGWNNYDGGNANTLTVVAASHRNGYRYRCLVTDSNGNQIISSAADLTISDVVATVVAHPTSMTAPQGSNAQFLAKVNGNVASYQWQFNDGYGWNDYVGGNADTLVVGSEPHRNNYQYRCVVTDANGNEILSDVAILKVGTAAAVEIKVQPNSMLAAAGTNAQFEVVVEGDVASYQWELLMDSSWTAVADKGTSSLLTVKAESHRNGFRYRCVITDTNGVQIISNAATLTIGDATAQIVVNSQSQVVAAGANATFTVVASGEVAGYQWQFNDGWGWNNYNGGNANTLTVEAASHRNGYRYRCLVTDSNGNQIISSAADLTISNVVATITAHPSSKYATVGTSATFSVAVDGDVAGYQWQFNDGYGWNNYNGGNANTLTIGAETYRNNYQYRCVITDANGNEILSDVAIFTVDIFETEPTLVEIVTQPVNQTVAPGTNVEFSVVAKGDELTYQWQTMVDGAWTNIADATAATLTVEASEANDGTQYQCVITNKYGLTATTATVTLTVEYPAGHANNPIDLTEDLLYGDPCDFSATVTVPAGKTYHYIAYRVGGMIMSINDGEGVACTTGGMMYPYAWTITNDGEADAEYVITVSYPVGTAENPETIWDLSEINVAIAEGNNQGYYYSYYNRAATGTISLSVASATEGVEYDVILTNTVSGDMAWLSDSEDGTVQMAVVPGDFVTIQVAVSPDADWNYPAADIVLNGEFIYPVGTAENPETIWDLSEINVAIAEGNNQGYYYSYYNRAATGTISLSVASATEGVEYDVILINTVSGDMAWLSDSEDGTVQMAVVPGDFVTIQVAVSPDADWNYPAADIVLNGEFIYPVGTAENPETIWDLSEINVAIAEGNNQGYYYSYYNRAATGTINLSVASATEGVEYDVILINTVSGDMAWLSDSEDGTVQMAVVPGDFVTIQVAVSPDADWNYPAADIVLNGEFIYPAGSMDNPAALKIGENTATIAAGSQGYFYTWTAEEDGKLTVAVSGANGWTYQVNNTTTGASTDTHWHDDETVVATEVLEVSAGDVITMMVNTYDPADMWSNPAGSIVVNASFEAYGDTEIEEDVTNPDDGEE